MNYLIKYSLIFLCLLSATLAQEDANTLINLKDFSKVSWRFSFDTEIGFEKPSFDDSKWQVLKAQQIDWLNLPKGRAHYHGYYRISFDYRENENANKLLLYFNYLSDADETFLNGYKIGQTGQFNYEGNIPLTQAYDRERIYSIPSGLLHSGKNVLAVHLQAVTVNSRGFGAKSGIYKIVSMQPFLSNRLVSQLQFLLPITLIFTLGLIFVFYFIVGKFKNLEVFFFGLSCIIFSIYFFLSNAIKYSFFNDFFIMKRLEYLMATLMFLPLTLFFYTFLPKKSSNRIFKILFVIVIIKPFLLLLPIFISNHITEVWYYVLFSIVQPLWLINIVVITWLLIVNLSQKNREAKLLLITMLISLLGIINDILANKDIMPWGRVGHWVFLILMLTFAIILADKFVNLHILSDIKSRQLLMLDNMKTSFLANFSSRIQDTVHSIRNLASQLNFMNNKDSLTRVGQISSNLSLQVENLLMITKIEAGDIETKPQEHSFENALNRLLETLSNRGDGEKVVVKCNHLKTNIYCNENILYHVLLRLIGMPITILTHEVVELISNKTTEHLIINIKIEANIPVSQIELWHHPYKSESSDDLHLNYHICLQLAKLGNLSLEFIGTKSLIAQLKIPLA